MEYELRGSGERHRSTMLPTFHTEPSIELASMTEPRRPGHSVKAPTDQGYPKLAHLMGNYPDHAIFRRFRWLSTLNIMRLQAELAQLEADLKALQREDHKLQSGLRPEETYSTSFKAMNWHHPPEQLEVMKRSSRVLQEYNALILQSAQVAALGAPEDEPLENLQDWLKRDDSGNTFQRGTELIGTWDRDHKRDFISLVPSSVDRGGMSKLFRPWVTKFTFRLLRCLPWKFTENKLIAYDRADRVGRAGPVYDLSSSKFLRAMRWVATACITAAISLMPALMILWLNSYNDTQRRIYVTIGATALLGLLMKAFTNANTKEILTTAIAFAAVEVVFIGSAAGSGSSSSSQ